MAAADAGEAKGEKPSRALAASSASAETSTSSFDDCDDDDNDESLNLNLNLSNNSSSPRLLRRSSLRRPAPDSGPRRQVGPVPRGEGLRGVEGMSRKERRRKSSGGAFDNDGGKPRVS